MTNVYPRLVFAGMAGDSGKTIVSLSVVSESLRRGIPVAVFKKGPDFIDAAWLRIAARTHAWNLDVYLQGPEYVRQSFTRHGSPGGLNIIEGNRGLYDGMETGENSTAELAKLLRTPVILVYSPVKVTRTAAAHVLGCLHFDPDVAIAGVILNRTAGERHERVIRTAIEETCGVPVLGAVPRLQKNRILPDRHLGLVTPEEAETIADSVDDYSAVCRDFIDFDAVRRIAFDVAPLDADTPDHSVAVPPDVRIGYFSDSAFTFYYPDNLEALEAAGAELVKISALHDTALPELDGLFIGGGFPETHAELLEENASLRYAVKEAAQNGMPIYAECGGLIYLTQSLRWNNRTFTMAGIFPVTVEIHKKPHGHGYMEAEVDRNNPFFPVGTIIRGHEFHYSQIVSEAEKPDTAYNVRRGVGCFDGRDGLLYKNVFASYMHVHAGGAREWAGHIVTAARTYRQNRESGPEHKTEE